LGAFFAPQKTGLCGAPRSRAPAPATPWLNPSNPLRASTHPKGVSGYNGPQITGNSKGPQITLINADYVWRDE
jgi:hypothetical protein